MNGENPNTLSVEVIARRTYLSGGVIKVQRKQNPPLLRVYTHVNLGTSLTVFTSLLFSQPDSLACLFM